MSDALFGNSAARSDGFRDVDPRTFDMHRDATRTFDVREPPARAARELVALGFERVINLRGGMLACGAAGLPVEQSR